MIKPSYAYRALDRYLGGGLGAVECALSGDAIDLACQPDRPWNAGQDRYRVPSTASVAEPEQLCAKPEPSPYAYVYAEPLKPPEWTLARVKPPRHATFKRCVQPRLNVWGTVVEETFVLELPPQHLAEVRHLSLVVGLGSAARATATATTTVSLKDVLFHFTLLLLCSWCIAHLGGAT